MSEMINNREYRQKILKELIMRLHSGQSVDEVRAEFEELIEGISASEISAMEQNLIMEGMPLEEVQRLCDVHAAVFKGSIEDIHRPEKPEETPGHPIHTFQLENREIEKLLDARISPLLLKDSEHPNQEDMDMLYESFKLLYSIDKHYSRKENLLFPYLEKYEITAPPKVMWGVDDEIRGELKEVLHQFKNGKGDQNAILNKAEKVIDKIREMIFKEESILFPMAVETLTEGEWSAIAEDSDEIGYCLTRPQIKWRPAAVEEEKDTAERKVESSDGSIQFETGTLTLKELNTILNYLPVDITFIDKNDQVKYFSQSAERIFARTKTVIGRSVQNCHPPASVHIVDKLIEDFKSGVKEHEDFWIRMGDLFVYIRYFAVREENGDYLGTLEVTQNIKPIQEIQGEKRLVSDTEQS